MSRPLQWPSLGKFEADAAVVVLAAVTGQELTFVAPDEEYAERVYARADSILRTLEISDVERPNPTRVVNNFGKRIR